MAEYERAGQILPENVINSKISKSLVFDLPCASTECKVTKVKLKRSLLGRKGMPQQDNISSGRQF